MTFLKIVIGPNTTIKPACEMRIAPLINKLSGQLLTDVGLLTHPLTLRIAHLKRDPGSYTILEIVVGPNTTPQNQLVRPTPNRCGTLNIHQLRMMKKINCTITYMIGTTTEEEKSDVDSESLWVFRSSGSGGLQSLM
ncbi:hypothetical protein MTR_3g450910 [Medicago truncatula]|uniref:Uncharacterized protein n=1 Tax=Medicago truncatula TaxID=3880 RepID=A0A072V686_MEDTR|nr:hypothetical protein MTR_3g450910 [Medicago truncatula]